MISVIHIWVSVMIYFSIQATEKYSTAMYYTACRVHTGTLNVQIVEAEAGSPNTQMFQINCWNVQMFGAGSPKAESNWSNGGRRENIWSRQHYSPFTVGSCLHFCFNCWSSTWLWFDVWDCIDRLGLRVADIRAAIWHQSLSPGFLSLTYSISAAY